MKLSAQSQRTRKQLLGLTAAALALTLGVGLVYGRWTQRWGPPPDLVAAAGRIANLPKQLGDWRVAEERTLADQVLDTLECAGYAHRVYFNPNTGKSVAVALLVGPPGPMSVHTPEVCFSSQAVDVAAAREKRFFKQTDGPVHSLWATQFKSHNAGADVFQVYYGWSAGGLWNAPTSPRFEYGGVPLLYKLEVAGPIEPDAKDRRSDPCQGFIDALLTNFWQPSGAGEHTHMELPH